MISPPWLRVARRLREEVCDKLLLSAQGSATVIMVFDPLADTRHDVGGGEVGVKVREQARNACTPPCNGLNDKIPALVGFDGGRLAVQPGWVISLLASITLAGPLAWWAWA